MDNRRATIYIDCTSTYSLGINTGLQRIVRNIIKRAPSIGEKFNVECIPVAIKFNRFWTSQEFHSLTPSSPSTSNVINFGASLAAAMVSMEERMAKATTPHVLRALFINLFTATRWAVRYVGYAGLQIPFVVGLIKGYVKTVRPSAGDIILMPDSFWSFDVISPQEKLDEKDVCVIPVIHDLIPLTHPEYCTKEFVARFKKLLPRLVENASGFVCVSHTTKDALSRYLRHNALENDRYLPIAVSYSGADLTNEPGIEFGALPLRDEIVALGKQEKVFLMVGTIEPRKGYDVSIDAMNSRWRAGKTETLVIIGRVGWHCDELIDQIKRHPYFNKNLYLFHDTNDHELNYLYQHSSALIFSSRIEGFGLPLVEAMQAGLPVIASRIPIFREIGKDALIYFDPISSESLSAAIDRFNNQRRLDAPSATKNNWYTWNDSTFNLIAKVLTLSSPRVRRKSTEA